jgi:hypothetical protein
MRRGVLAAMVCARATVRTSDGRRLLFLDLQTLTARR